MANPDRQPLSPDVKRALLRPGFPFASPRRWGAMIDKFDQQTPSQHTDAMLEDMITSTRDFAIAGGLLAIPEPFVTKLAAAGFILKGGAELIPAIPHLLLSDFIPPLPSRRDRPTDTPQI